jgi:nucleotide-binding universal stress UspA family protein
MNEETHTAPRCRTSAGPQPAISEFGFSHLVTATDFSPRSEKAIEFSLQLAQRLGARLTLLHLVPEVSAMEYTMGGIPFGYEDEAWEKAEQKLAEEVEHAKRVYGQVDPLLRKTPSISEGILEVVRELSADLVVLSTHGYSGWRHLLFGSDAEKILEQAPCPVVVVR